MLDIPFRCVITNGKKKYRSIFITHWNNVANFSKKKKISKKIRTNSLPWRKGRKIVRRSINFSTDYKFTREFLLAGASANRFGRSVIHSLIASSNREQLKRARKIMFWPRCAAACVERAIFTRDTICFRVWHLVSSLSGSVDERELLVSKLIIVFFSFFLSPSPSLLQINTAKNGGTLPKDNL